MKEKPCGIHGRSVQVVLETGDAKKIYDKYGANGFSLVSLIMRGQKTFSPSEAAERKEFIKDMKAAGCNYTEIE